VTGCVGPEVVTLFAADGTVVDPDRPGFRLVTDVDLVEIRDRSGAMMDRYRLSNLGGAPLKRRGDRWV
jgi:hypothetical protein